MRIIKSLVFTVALMFGSVAVANANIMLWLDPSVQSPVSAGDDISLKIMISGLGDNSPLSLGAFDLDVSFDSSVLSFSGYTLFDELGNVGLFEADDFSFGEYAPGAINLYEVSYLFDFELDSLQPGMFALAELFFHVDVLNSGESTFLSLFANSLTDAIGRTLDITVGDDAIISTPTPAPLPLLVIALLTIFIRLNKIHLVDKFTNLSKRN